MSLAPNLEKLKQKLAYPEPFLNSLGKEMLKLVRSRFDSKQAPDGSPWAPWASSTANARRAAGTESLGLLVLTGTLRDGTEAAVFGKQLSITNSTPYAGFLQNGTKFMPPRPFVGWGPQETKVARETFNKWIGQ